MKKIILLLIILSVLACQEKPKDVIIIESGYVVLKNSKVIILHNFVFEKDNDICKFYEFGGKDYKIPTRNINTIKLNFNIKEDNFEEDN